MKDVEGAKTSEFAELTAQIGASRRGFWQKKDKLMAELNRKMEETGAGDSANEQAGRAEETEEERFSRVVRQETGSTSDDDHHDALHTEP